VVAVVVASEWFNQLSSSDFISCFYYPFSNSGKPQPVVSNWNVMDPFDYLMIATEVA
jgi:hypothetical protein